MIYKRLVTMPRKTRKEKIIADLRRKLQHLEISPMPTSVEPLPEPQQDTVKKTPVDIDITRFSSDTSFIKKDLKKTLFISTLAIVVEFVLYLATK